VLIISDIEECGVIRSWKGHEKRKRYVFTDTLWQEK